MSLESVMPSNHLILYCPFILLPSIFPNIRVFSNKPALCIRWPKDWSFSFNISPSNEYPGQISFRMENQPNANPSLPLSSELASWKSCGILYFVLGFLLTVKAHTTRKTAPHSAIHQGIVESLFSVRHLCCHWWRFTAEQDWCDSIPQGKTRDFIKSGECLGRQSWSPREPCLMALEH